MMRLCKLSLLLGSTLVQLFGRRVGGEERDICILLVGEGLLLEFWYWYLFLCSL
jgi:hypothetical protein